MTSDLHPDHEMPFEQFTRMVKLTIIGMILFALFLVLSHYQGPSVDALYLSNLICKHEEGDSKCFVHGETLYKVNVPTDFKARYPKLFFNSPGYALLIFPGFNYNFLGKIFQYKLN